MAKIYHIKEFYNTPFGRRVGSAFVQKKFGDWLKYDGKAQWHKDGSGYPAALVQMMNKKKFG